MKSDIEELNRDFDRISSIMKQVDSGKFPIVFIMSTTVGDLEFVIGGNLDKEQRITFVKTLVESYNQNGSTEFDVKFGSGSN
jgi:hypothetical protein